MGERERHEAKVRGREAEAERKRGEQVFVPAEVAPYQGPDVVDPLEILVRGADGEERRYVPTSSYCDLEDKLTDPVLANAPEA